MSKQRAIVLCIVVAAGVILAGGLIAVRALGSGGSTASRDRELSARARALFPSLNNPGGRLPITDGSLTSFQAWVYDEEPVFNRLTKHEKGAVFDQLVFEDPVTMPPQVVPIPSLRHSIVPVDPNVFQTAVKTGHAQYTDTQQGGASYRVYVVPLTTPAPLQSVGAVGVLEVVTATTGPAH